VKKGGNAVLMAALSLIVQTYKETKCCVGTNWIWFYALEMFLGKNIPHCSSSINLIFTFFPTVDE
jgi:hypothetical protein